MLTIEASTIIDRPLEEIFDYVVDLRNSVHYSAEVVAARKTSDGPVGLGSTFAMTVQIMGRRLESSSEIVEYEPYRSVALEHDAGPLKAQDDRFTFERVDGGTKVTHRAAAETGGLFRLADPVLSRLMRRQWETNLAVLKELLESQLAPIG